MLALTFEFCVKSILEVSAGAKVDELQVEGLEIHKEVFILDIPMDDTFPVASEHRLDDLPEKVSRELLLQDSLLRDEVKEIFAVRGLLHDVDEGVVPFVEVEQPDDAVDGLDLGKELELKRYSVTIHLKDEK